MPGMNAMVLMKSQDQDFQASEEMSQFLGHFFLNPSCALQCPLICWIQFWLLQIGDITQRFLDIWFFGARRGMLFS